MGIATISKSEWKEMMSGDVIVIDIRTSGEHHDDNIPRSINLNYHSPEFIETLSQMDKGKTYLIHCQSGMRGSNALKVFVDLGFSSVYNLDGGLNSF
jgi:rhodanese-related sulfurtransferase